MLRNGTPAPDFTLQDAEGQSRSLATLRQGKPLLLLFFRGEFCPTARLDLMKYANIYSRFTAVDADIAAISTDTPEHHRTLRQTLQLPFPLLSDLDFAVAARYGVYRSDETEEGPQPHGEPAVFILDVDGRIAYSQIQTGPKGAAAPADMALIFLYMCQNGGRY